MYYKSRHDKVYSKKQTKSLYIMEKEHPKNLLKIKLKLERED